MRGEQTAAARRQDRDRWQVRIFLVIILFMGVCTYVQLFEERSIFSVQDRTSLKTFMSSVESTTSSFTNKMSLLALSSLSSAFDRGAENDVSSVSEEEEKEEPRFYAPVLHHEYYSVIQPQSKSRAATKGKVGFQDADMSRLQSAAKIFLQERIEAYQREKSLQTFKLRGIGYLYTVHKMILAANVPDHPQLFKNNTIRIHDVYDGPILNGFDGENNTTSHNNFTRHDSPRKDCHLFTIWVRVMGPELFAGTAQAIQPDDPTESCYWEFPFYLQVPGDYQAHAKSLLYDGYADRHITSGSSSQCSVIHKKDLRNYDLAYYKNITEQYPLHAGFQGFKLYDAPGSCCEVCSRMPDCQYWATPAFDMPAPSFPTNGCELFFAQSAADKNVVPESKRIPEMIAEFQMQEEEKEKQEKELEKQEKEKQEKELEKGQGPQQRRRIQQQQYKLLPGQQQRRRRLQVDAYHGARHNYPSAYFVGCHWSFWYSLDFGCLSGELDDQVFMLHNNFTVKMVIDASKAKDEKHALAMMNREVDPSLPVCELSNIKFNQNGGRWVRQDWPNSTICPFPMKHVMINDHFPLTAHNGDYPRCWHRDNLNILKTSCFEMNCRFIRVESYWRGPLQEEKEWFGVWRYNDCNLLEFTDPQIQQCINQHNISGFETHGASISGYVRDYMDHRLQNMTLVNETTNKHTTTVHYDTVAAPHLTWRNDEEKWRVELENKKPLSNFHYIVLPFYWASERETYVHAMNAEKMAVLFEQILAPKGFRIINSFDLTKVFPYDTATQSDGLHIIGPPLKMLSTIVFHDLCKDVVKGGTFV